MYKPVNVIEVRIRDQTVGAVALDPRLGYYAFEYAPAFVRTGVGLAPLTMPLEQAAAPFIFADLPEPACLRLPAMLADALPDDFGNNLINAWMAAKGISKSSITPLDRLAYMGKRGIGALEFKPARSPAVESCTAINLSKMVEDVRHAVRGEISTGQIAKAELMQIIREGRGWGEVKRRPRCP